MENLDKYVENARNLWENEVNAFNSLDMVLFMIKHTLNVKKQGLKFDISKSTSYFYNLIFTDGGYINEHPQKSNIYNKMSVYKYIIPMFAGFKDADDIDAFVDGVVNTSILKDVNFSQILKKIKNEKNERKEKKETAETAETAENAENTASTNAMPEKIVISAENIDKIFDVCLKELEHCIVENQTLTRQKLTAFIKEADALFSKIAIEKVAEKTAKNEFAIALEKAQAKKKKVA